METTVQIAEGAASQDPEVGRPAVAALRTLAERLGPALGPERADSLAPAGDLARRRGATKETGIPKYGRAMGRR